MSSWSPWPICLRTELVPARARLKELSPNQVQVDDDHLFHGFDAYKKVLESDVDVVVIAADITLHSPPSPGGHRGGQARVLREAAWARRAGRQVGHQDL